jgi:hypothetical protein
MRITFILTLVAAAMVAAGCGQSDSEKFTDQAEKVCAQATKDVNAIQASGGTPIEKAQKLEAEVASLKADLSKLKPPSDKQVAFQTYLNQIGQLQAVVGELQTAAKNSDQQAAAALVPRLRQVQAQGEQAAKNAGLTSCGR